MIKFTVFTPTYNRVHTLERLYRSLESQNLKDFEWLIVDDGSTDCTGEYVKDLQTKSSFNIKYIYQDNSGKQTAYNVGIVNAESVLFICVDSDDQLTSNALKELDKEWNSLNAGERENCAGIVFLNCDLSGTIIGTELPNIRFSTMYDLYNRYSVKGDKGLLFQTEVLKKYRFPIQSGEIFITEAVLYNRICKTYKLYCLNKVLEIRDYQSDGLSSRYNQLMLENPVSSAIYYNELNFYENEFRKRVKNDAVHTKFRLLGKSSIFNIYKNSLNKKFFIIGFSMGYLMYIKNKSIGAVKSLKQGASIDT